MGNAVARSAGQNCLDSILLYFELFRDFGDARAISRVVHNRANRHSSSPPYGRAALRSQLDLPRGILTNRFVLLNPWHPLAL